MPLRLVRAPAGAGKTSALIAWVQHRATRGHDQPLTIWVTVDGALNERTAFWEVVIHHVRAVGRMPADAALGAADASNPGRGRTPTPG